MKTLRYPGLLRIFKFSFFTGSLPEERLWISSALWIYTKLFWIYIKWLNLSIKRNFKNLPFCNNPSPFESYVPKSTNQSSNLIPMTNDHFEHFWSLLEGFLWMIKQKHFFQKFLLMLLLPVPTRKVHSLSYMTAFWILHFLLIISFLGQLFLTTNCIMW